MNWLRQKVRDWDAEMSGSYEDAIAAENVRWSDVLDWLKWRVLGR